KLNFLFSEEVQVTNIIEYGMAWEDLLSSRTTIPPQGARFDIAFEATFKGPEISGTLKGIDFLKVRPDGKFMIDIQATMITRDGESIALHENGVLYRDAEQPYVGKLRLTMDCSTASEKYKWVNDLQIWGNGMIDMSKGIGHIEAHS
ncbi:MAG: DUF3237 family protein, partial [Balneolaceae bacterium]